MDNVQRKKSRKNIIKSIQNTFNNVFEPLTIKETKIVRVSFCIRRMKCHYYRAEAH